MASLKYHSRDRRWVLSEYLGRTPEGRMLTRSKNFTSPEAAEEYATAAGIAISTRQRRSVEQVTAHLAANTATTAAGCQIWTSHLTNAGYGRLSWVDDSGFTQRGAHRVAYSALVEPVPADKVLDHLCRQRACIRVDHLEIVTTRENTMRSPIALAALNAQKTHCPSGHAYTPDNTYATKTGRVCRTCTLTRNRKRVTA